MIIRIHKDRAIEALGNFDALVEREIEEHLGGFVERITRLEVVIADENGIRKGPEDKRVTITAHPAGRKMVAVTAHADKVETAITRAAKKLFKALERSFGKDKVWKRKNRPGPRRPAV